MLARHPLLYQQARRNRLLTLSIHIERWKRTPNYSTESRPQGPAGGRRIPRRIQRTLRGKKIAYNSILGVIKGLRADCAAQAQLVPTDVEEAAEKYGREKFLECQEYGSCGESDLAEAYAAGMLAERERMASCPTIKGWVARDENGQLWLYAQRPFRNHTVWTTDKGRYFIRINDTFLPDLRWEDEPIEAEIIVKTKQ